MFCTFVCPLVYSGNGCVAMRMVCTWYPRDSNVVCARRSIFNASATCSLYRTRSRLINAVIARILGLAGTAAVFACARRIPELPAKANNSTATEFRRNRIKVCEFGYMEQCSCKWARCRRRTTSLQDSVLRGMVGLNAGQQWIGIYFRQLPKFMKLQTTESAEAKWPI